MKLKIVIKVSESITSEQMEQIEKGVKRKLGSDVDVLVLNKGLDAEWSNGYTIEEKIGDYHWKASVQTFDELLKIAEVHLCRAK
ncbi:hypothetical protein LCGC14_0248600 [marine sediment metagenome]|uniref:Uncharacterized protein n=1 Tax=marine sediment metagenome TaxID=412755 RepID=A0A0F9X9N0_9ZZZZ